LEGEGFIFKFFIVNEGIVPLNFTFSSCLEAYLSRAEIFREKNNITLAILNYTQAIKCMPTNADVYFRRGEMYEKANKVLAVDDYSKVSLIVCTAAIYVF
jgi:tetratricopeptide (TPR) repeat protein